MTKDGMDEKVGFRARASGPVCLIGIEEDPVLQAVAAQLERRGEAYVLFDQNRFPGGMSLSYGAAAGCRVEGELLIDGVRHPLASFKSAYLRFLAAPPDEDAASERAAWESERFLSLDNLTRAWDVPTIGLIAPCATNFSKPYQISLVRSAEVLVPQTLLASRPESVREWRAGRGEVSFKSTSSERSICVRLDEGWESRLPLISKLPVQFQEYVKGLDIRAHVVGERVFALAIETDASDYRYSQRHFGQAPRIDVIELPESLKRELIAITRRLGLVVSGIDLRRTPDGRYFCFEVNPTPGFAYFDPEPDFPIANAICDLLTGKAHV